MNLPPAGSAGCQHAGMGAGLLDLSGQLEHDQAGSDCQAPCWMFVQSFCRNPLLFQRLGDSSPAECRPRRL